ncbi:peroxisomal (S)-2-hydroxy-acid oxidase GLO4-like [Stegodyphus dumicola]|uniref:peroxisomal (S)-2-hydroxy-acid oxidase GLO4-like n=1 Tax=Stegodyphus dumicola TaxID=202533 RepID=UPI0015A7A9FE|nr:peroxisomal (S)-2-hydroxy-acid oxidase GLO4-like [Stegodyphus dumicola]
MGGERGKLTGRVIDGTGFRYLKHTEIQDHSGEVPCDTYFQPNNCDLDKLRRLTVDDFDRCAPAYLEIPFRNYFLGAAGRRITYQENIKAYRRVKILPKILRDVSRNEVTTTVLGLDVDFPIGISPVAQQKFAHPEGEVATAAALGGMKTVMILSTLSSSLIEDVAFAARNSPSHLWMQVYVFQNRSITIDIIRRAERAGFKAIVVTVDSPILGDVTCGSRSLAGTVGDGFANLPNRRQMPPLDASLTFKDITWLTSITRLPIIAKGVLSGDDAKRAVLAGASAVLVSNHGGRQVDTAPATIDVLPDVVEAVNQINPRGEVYIDGGIRSGNDVFKALAMGAKMAFIGRPTIWGLAWAGSHGVKTVLQILRTEFNETMIMAGTSSPCDVRRATVIPGRLNYGR